MLKSIYLLLSHLLLVSASTINSTSLPQINQPICLNYHAQVRHVLMTHCLTAVTLINREPDFWVPQSWTCDTSAGWIVKKWTWNTCTVAVVAEHAMVHDEFAPSQVADMAAFVIADCVGGAEHYGGRIKIGPSRVFDVGVAHKRTFELGVQSARRA